MQVGDSKPGFYAIASPPDPNNAGHVELLIKSIPGTTAEILAGSSAGAALRSGSAHSSELAKQNAVAAAAELLAGHLLAKPALLTHSCCNFHRVFITSARRSMMSRILPYGGHLSNWLLL
jgi:hypothetical protein